jgi:DNA-binding beta-propeller fold protein YncE
MNKKSLGMLGMAAILCALLIGWVTKSGREHHPWIAFAQPPQSDNWATPEAQRLGIRLVEMRDPSGPAAYSASPGDLLFFTNSGTSYMAQNTKNSVVVINAKTKKPIAISDLDSYYTEKYGSHGIGVSPDGKYIYLPNIESIATLGSRTPNSTLVIEARTLKIYQVIASGGTPHHAKVFRDSMGRSRVFIEDWTWNIPNTQGKSFYVLDPANNNKVVAGMLPEEIHGSTYTGFTTPDGKYMYYSVPPPSRGELMRDVQGWLAKIDMDTWKVTQSIPMKHYPLWTVFSKDGKWAWVSQSVDETVLKIERGTGPRGDKVVAEVKTGMGPYGIRLSIDDKELWVADKGEVGPKDGATITIIDAEKNQVKRTLQTNCLRNDHIVMSPDGQEMWAACNTSHEIVVLDSKTYEIKNRIPMPNGGDSHGGVFVSYRGTPGNITAEVVSDINGLQGSALDAALKGNPWSVASLR